MKRSTDRILTTHVGSLVRPPGLVDLMRAKDSGQAYDHEAENDQHPSFYQRTPILFKRHILFLRAHDWQAYGRFSAGSL